MTERFNDWVEVDGYGQFRLIGPLDRFIVDTATTAVCTGTFVNTVGGTVTLEPYAFLGNNVSFLTGSHPIDKYEAERMHGLSPKAANIRVGRGAWIANNCTIIGPCDIGEHAVITAGTVVRGVVPPYAVIGPQPWRIIRMLEEPMQSSQEQAIAAVRDQPDFDRNWIGPAHLKPRVYRSQLEKDTWYSVVVNDEYGLPAFAPEDVVLDIGGHIGSVSWLAQNRGSRSVYAFEPNEWHFDALRQNLDGLDGVTASFMAVVRSDAGRAESYAYGVDTWTVIRGHGAPVPSISLDEIIERTGPVRFLKIDCEGSEWPILGTCTKLDQIAEITGEYHPIVNPLDREAAELAGLPAYDADGLMVFLAAQGFVSVGYQADRPGDPHSLGKFWAVR